MDLSHFNPSIRLQRLLTPKDRPFAGMAVPVTVRQATAHLLEALQEGIAESERQRLLARAKEQLDLFGEDLLAEDQLHPGRPPHASHWKMLEELTICHRALNEQELTAEIRDHVQERLSDLQQLGQIEAAVERKVQAYGRIRQEPPQVTAPILEGEAVERSDRGFSQRLLESQATGRTR